MHFFPRANPGCLLPLPARLLFRLMSLREATPTLENTGAGGRNAAMQGGYCMQMCRNKEGTIH